ncbi:DUF4249 domain-containing protein [Flavobacterium pectinovorum]|uniref:DUF4249 domain-containing protein n=1 Tax=Flavobacterium pectinovorum TaxID=29533 RepID=A0A502ETK4_9FLAO|nr:DUF4249 domain-containing protein [Flavobacterium pectinovorum]TPG39431.1 DUF4249 domain-containing protein [Flavobacterium pectinovorum]
MHFKTEIIKHTNKIILFFLLSFFISSCSESYNLQTDTYEEAIVIEATLTNELKNQEIKITKTSRFEDEEVTVETGANVIVKDNLNNEYLFTEKSGKYVSESAFEVVSGRQYSLEIKTKDGKVYKSSSETLPTVSPITDITPSVVVNNKNETGIQMNANSYDANRTSNYYRYEYEETFKIVAPRWTSERAVVTGPKNIRIDDDNDPAKKICYSTQKSTDIIVTSTNNLTEDRVNFPVRFIKQDDYKIAQRYSILVRQYVENKAAYTFHKTMKEISSSTSVLSPKQPGVFSGNIRCISNVDEKVMGYFDVASVSSQRIFFNYTDFFPSTDKPAYISECEPMKLNFCFEANTTPPCDGYTIISGLQGGGLLYYFGSYVEAICGDCTKFSSNVIPSFWKE